MTFPTKNRTGENTSIFLEGKHCRQARPNLANDLITFKQNEDGSTEITFTTEESMIGRSDEIRRLKHDTFEMSISADPKEGEPWRKRLLFSHAEIVSEAIMPNGKTQWTVKAANLTYGQKIQRIKDRQAEKAMAAAERERANRTTRAKYEAYKQRARA